MAITVSYVATPFLITIPKSDLTLESGTKYNLTVDVFWQLLRDYADSEEGIVNPVIYTRIAATASTPSITEVNADYYSLQFEDGAYSVNVIEGNTNIRDVEVKNTVSVNTNNTTGFIDQSVLVHGTFNSGIYWDYINGSDSIQDLNTSGNESNPLKNLVDVQTQAVSKGFRKIHVVEDATVGATENIDGYVLEGINSSQTIITFIAGAVTGETSFMQACLTGDLGGSLYVKDCALLDLVGVGGTAAISRFMETAFEGGTITIESTNTKEIHFVSCEDASLDNPPILDINGSVGNITMRQFSGHITVKNLTGTTQFSFDTTGGYLTIDSTCTGGTISIKGAAGFTDNSGAGCTVVDETTSTLTNHHIERSVWIDTGQVAAGDGSQKLPFNTLTAGVDYAEAEGLRTLRLYDDVVIDRQLKNFNMEGTGQPAVDCNGQNLNKSEFFHCNLEGVALGTITVQQAVLLTGLSFNGFAEKCAINGDISINGPTHIIESYSNAPGAAYISITTGANILQVSNWHRSLGIKGMTGGTHTIEMYGGQLHLDATCIGGTLYLRGNYSVAPNDQSAGTVLIDQTENEETWTNEKALNVDTYIGLS